MTGPNDPLATGRAMLCPKCGSELSAGGSKIPLDAMTVCPGCTKILLSVGGPWAEIMEPIRVPPSRYAEFEKLERHAAELRRQRQGSRL